MEKFQKKDSDFSVEFFQKILAHAFPEVCLESVQVNEASGRGDNYTSMVYRVKAVGTKNSEPWSKSFVYKCLPLNRVRREAFKSDALFLNEVSFYTKALPTLIKFQSSRGCDDLIQVPQVYFAKKNILVLEDLKEKQYIMADRKKNLNVEHCEAVIRALAKFHSLSLAMKFLEPEQFKTKVVSSVEECMFKPENEEWYREYYKTATKNAIGFVKESLTSPEEKKKYLEKFESFLDNSFFQRMVSIIQPKEPVSVICHGDCWTNNILFKYTDAGQLYKLCFLDFQLVRYGSPALDLVNFLYVCTSRPLRANHMANLISLYCDCIKESLVKLGCPKAAFGGEDLYKTISEEVRRCGKFGLGLAIDMIPISTCDSDQAPDLYADVSDDGDGDGENCEKPVWTKNEICRRRMTELVQELVDKNHL